MPLTKQQHQLMIIIQNFIETNNYSPSFEELKELSDLRSKSSIHYFVEILERKGYIRRSVGKTRNIELIKNIKVTRLKSKIDVDYYEFPKELTKNVDDWHKLSTSSFSSDMLDSDKSYFMIKMPDDTMETFGIMLGDTLLFKKTTKFSKELKFSMILQTNVQFLICRASRKNDNIIVERGSNVHANLVLNRNGAIQIGELVYKFKKY
ncbi:MAG: hypothetical protein JJV93_02610 [Alphaproteobacteria bacterium]|nr:hypothetical protein [Alphaproteobacteria bacterium]MBL0718121.1 hypothetical protein [Alphaproteobacteria bacterium]